MPDRTQLPPAEELSMDSPRRCFLRLACPAGTALAALWQPALAHACTVCDSPAGHAVRAGLFNGHFLHTLVLILLPFPTLALVVLFLGIGMPDLPRSEPSCPQPPNPLSELLS